jgi:hypothetical protein
MKRTLLLALALIAVVPVDGVAQGLPEIGEIVTYGDGKKYRFQSVNADGTWRLRPLGLVNEVIEGRDCGGSSRVTCAYRIGNDLDFEIVNVGDPNVFINVWAADGKDGDFFMGTTPDAFGRLDAYPCIVIKPGSSNPTYKMIIDIAYVSPRTGDVYDSEVDCKTDG